MFWLLSYASAFITLHLSRKHHNVTESFSNCNASEEARGVRPEIVCDNYRGTLTY